MIMASIAQQWVLVPRVLAALEFPAKKQGVYMDTTMNYLPGDPAIKPLLLGSILMVHKLFRKFRL